MFFTGFPDVPNFVHWGTLEEITGDASVNPYPWQIGIPIA
jgi:hypothetical protein